MLLGHEAAGLVAELGTGVDDVAVGDRVVMTFLPRCGRCPGCATGGRLPCGPGSAANAAGDLLGGGRRLTRDGVPVAHHLGVSAFAEQVVVDRRSVVPVDPDVPAEVAALLGCAVLTGGGAVLNAARPEPGSPVLVVGLGGVGMAALLVAQALGHPVHRRRHRARQARDGRASWGPSPRSPRPRRRARRRGADGRRGGRATPGPSRPPSPAPHRAGPR